MNVELNHVDTYLMLSNNDPNAFIRMVLDTEHKADSDERFKENGVSLTCCFR